MKHLMILIFSISLLTSCASQKNTKKASKEKPVRIANEELEYEIIIFDIGFESYLRTIAKPEGYYSESYLENKNKFYVNTWNTRALNPLNYDSSIYENTIDYSSDIHYGLEVNYKLYNYFKFVEYKYKEKF